MSISYILKQKNLIRNSTIKKEIRNGCLVIVPCRVGMQKVDPEYIDAIRFIFFYPNITMGAVGGKPG
jgi:hypothetical protein